MKTIGFLGLGAIGLPLAQRLAGGAAKLIVFDPRLQAMEKMAGSAELASSPRQVGEQAELVFSCLTGTAAHREALFGPDGLAQGSRLRTYVHLGTTGPAVVRELADELGKNGVETIDAPITGGVARARNGTLTAMVACARPAFERLKPLIALYAAQIVWLGERPGGGQVMKLVNNAVSLANLAAACEALVMGAKEGLDPEAMLAVLNTGTGQNSATSHKIPSAVLTGSFDVGGTMRLVLKDLQAYLDHAADLGVDAAIGTAVLRAYSEAVETVSLDGDVTEVIRPMEKAAGVLLRKA